MGGGGTGVTRDDLGEMLQVKCINHLQHHIHIMYVQYVDLQCTQNLCIRDTVHTISTGSYVACMCMS